MNVTSTSPRSGQRTAPSNAAVLLHGHQLERNLARAVTAEAAGTFVLVLAITSAAVAPALSRPAAGTPYGSLAVPVAGGLALQSESPASATSRGATGRRRNSCRPLRQAPAGRQHTCLAVTTADDDLPDR
jgi:hypothetical protein